MDEAAWRDRGYYLVEVDTEQALKHEARLVRNPRRPFRRLSLGVDTYESPEALYAAAEDHAKREAKQQPGRPQPVLELTLEGVLAFDRHELDAKRLETILEEAFDPLLVRVINRTVPTEYEVSGDESKSRAELERDVIEDLVERDARYRPAAADWTEVILNVKRLTSEGTSPEGILEYLETSSQPIES